MQCLLYVVQFGKKKYGKTFPSLPYMARQPLALPIRIMLGENDVGCEIKSLSTASKMTYLLEYTK